MKSNQIPTWGYILIFFFGLQIFQNFITPILYPFLTSLAIPFYLQVIMMLGISNIVLLEVVCRFFFLQSLRAPSFSPSQLTDWPKLNSDAFSYYTKELEGLGFKFLGDYSSPTVKGMIRLFIHQEHYCMAEVGQIENHPIQCYLVSWLDDGWSLAVSNSQASFKQSSVAYAFFRLPRNLRIRIKGAEPYHLLELFQEWRGKVLNDLRISYQRELSVETYFSKERENFSKYGQRLLYSSLTWRLIEMYLFRLNPKMIWLGEYSKFRTS